MTTNLVQYKPLYICTKVRRIKRLQTYQLPVSLWVFPLPVFQPQVGISAKKNNKEIHPTLMIGWLSTMVYKYNI